jgi:transposase InsO family protein
MTDNGSCYRSFAFRRACKRLGHLHPETNGKAECLIALEAVFAA